MTEQRGKAVGQQLGNYRLQRLLGTGGFADVYLGEHLHLRTLAAIKVLHTKLAGDEVDIFLQEGRLIASLSHPHIIRVFDFNVEYMVPFLVMDYAPGGTLRQRHPKGTRLPLAIIVEYVKQIADGLQYAHDQKLVHRDIKPENMLVNQHGNIVISDFGVALIAHSTESQTVVEMAGTLPYIAPEQLQGLPRPSSDQYSLAVVIYEWISGTRPFQGTFAEIVSQHMVRTPASLADHFPEISPAVENVIFKALSKDPRERFATIQEFAAALEQAYLGTSSLKPQTGNAGLISTSTSMATQTMQTSYPEMMSAATQSGARIPSHSVLEQDLHANTPPSYPSTLHHSNQETLHSAHTIPGAPEVAAVPQSNPRRNWKPIAIILPLLLILISGGVFYAFQQTKGSFVPTTEQVKPTPTIDSHATAAAVHATTTAQASTPQGLYSVVTSQPPSFSDSLAEQSARGWANNSACTFSGGKYVISASPGTFAPCSTASTNLCNLGYQVQMTTLSGDGGGVIFRDTGNGYRLRVSPDGSYDLVTSSYTVTSGNSGAIQQGINVTNQLTIIAQDSKIFLYINSQYIASMTDKTSSCGNIGLMSVGGNAAFSDVKVWSL